jgi:hypothetical protein
MNKTLSLFLAFLTLCPPLSAAAETSLRDGRFFVDGKPFFVTGIGYEAGSRPGELPWSRPFAPAMWKRDLPKLRAAGFNTLRTWSPLKDEELALVQAAGFKVLMGLWLEPRGPFGDPAHVEKSLALIRAEIPRLKKWPCILGYLILNEPPAEAILHDRAAFRAFTRRMTEEIRRLGETRPVSMAAAAVDDFEPGDGFDFAGVNLYPYNPVTATVLGYRRMVEYLKRDFAAGRPLVVTEFGLSVSPRGEGNFGYGGNTPAQQREGVLAMAQAIRAAGAAGYCVFAWNDGWWKNNETPGDEKVHDPDPEEWFGLLGIEGSLSSPREELRPVYGALKDFQTGPAPSAAPLPEGRLLLDPLPARLKAGDALTVSGAISGGAPLPASVRVGVHGHDGWNPGRTMDVPVGPDGRFRADFRVLPSDLILTVSVAAGEGAWDAARVEISSAGGR